MGTTVVYRREEETVLKMLLPVVQIANGEIQVKGVCREYFRLTQSGWTSCLHAQKSCARPVGLRDGRTMDFGSINVELVAKLLLLLLVGLGPKIALVPFLDKTKGMSPAEQRATDRLMVQTAVVTALVIFAIGALLMQLLHITSGAVAIAGGIILALLAVRMASGPGEGVVVHGGCQMAESDARPAPTVCALVVVASLATACQPTNHLPASNAPLRSRAVAANFGNRPRSCRPGVAGPWLFCAQHE